MATTKGSPPDWDALAQLIARLADTRAVFPTAITHSNWISAYEPDRRFTLHSDARTTWVLMEHIRACWATFERRGRIRRRDVLEPGRQSAFMMALFEQLPGVERDLREDDCLVFADRHDAS